MKIFWRTALSILIAFIIAYIIYLINRGFGNSIVLCLRISGSIFLNIVSGFLAYFFIRDLYSKRWTSINYQNKIVIKSNSLVSTHFLHDQHYQIVIKRFYLPIDKINKKNEQQNYKDPEHFEQDKLISKYINLNDESSFSNEIENKINKKESLYSELIYKKSATMNNDTTYNSHDTHVSSTNKYRGIIIFLHGFNSSATRVRHYTIALANLGYIVFCYDARGLEKSKSAGKRDDFLKRNRDLEKIIDIFRHHPGEEMKKLKIFLMGESMGGICSIAALYKEFSSVVEKIGEKLARNKIPSDKNIARRAILNELSRIIPNRILSISIPSIFNRTFKRHLFPLSKAWFRRLNYILKGIEVYPKGSKNFELSPQLLLIRMKSEYKRLFLGTNLFDQKEADDLWRSFINGHLYLIHSKTDKLFTIEKFIGLVDNINLKKRNYTIFNKGGHNQIKNELGIIAIADSFFRHD